MEQKVQWLADSLYIEGHLTNYECCSLETIGNGIKMLANLKVLVTREEMAGLGK